MKNNTKKLVKAGLVLCIAVLLVGTSVTAIEDSSEKSMFASTTKSATLGSSMRDEVELRYYEEDGLSTVIGLNNPVNWKTAIRLTQDEMGPYMDWTMKSVNVAFSADNGHPIIFVRIYIYDKGTSSTKPGALIVNDTTATLDVTGITTIPLVTPVDLEGHDELWVAVEWFQTDPAPCHYAWMDTITGPHIPDKSDFYYLNNVWGQLHVALPTADGRWGIGAIIEGEGGIAQLSIANIKGPMGIKADIQNIGEKEAKNIEWTIAVTGGILKNVNATATGTAATVAAGSSTPASVGMFIGFGKISIAINAKAQNAVAVGVSKSAFLLGPFVLGIK